MKLPSISYDPISKLIDLLVDAGIDKMKEKADRSAKVIAIRKQLNLGAEKPLADDFDGVYAFTLAKYYEGDYPKAILEFFVIGYSRNSILPVDLAFSSQFWATANCGWLISSDAISVRIISILQKIVQ